MIAIVDYGVGNLYSLHSSFKYLGEQSVVSGDAAVIRRAERIILPGVGAFGDAAAKLRASGLDKTLRQEAASGKPLLGICLGMQLLLEKGFEYGEHTGLALIPGNICPMQPLLPSGLKIPHIGWNGLQFPAGKPKHPLFAQVEEGECVYFVHSFYAADCDSDVLAYVEYGGEFTAAVGRGNVLGVQFHPEKSGLTGLHILQAFCRM